MITKKILNRKKLNPSTPVFTGIHKEEPISAQLFKYNEQAYVEAPEYSMDQTFNIQEEAHNYWLNIHGIHDSEKIITLCDQLGIHKLVQQDILDLNQRPKFQDYDS